MKEFPLLEVKNLETQFFTEDGVVHAVNRISYTLDEGETLAIVGESGCGKTVGVLSIVNLIPSPPGKITGGEILLNGQDLHKLSQADLEDIRGKDIGMVFQDPNMSLTPVLTIGEQITETLMRHLPMTKAQARKRAIELLEMVNIPNAASHLDDYPHQLSAGVRQRAMIAIAIACEPKIVVADEPTTHLDLTIQAEILDLVKRLQKEFGMAVIWITHDLGVVAGLAQRVIVMYAGAIVEQGTVRDIYKTPQHPYTKGLLNSVPRLDQLQQERLVSIDGLPPDLIEIPDRCAFAPRCPVAVDRCWQEIPPLDATSPTQRVACWLAFENGRNNNE